MRLGLGWVRLNQVRLQTRITIDDQTSAVILFRFYLYFLVFYLKFPIFLVFCGILYGFLGIYLDFIVFMESKGCLHKLSNYLFWVIWSHDLANLFEFLEPPSICLAHSVLIWLYIIFLVIFWIFLGFFGIYGIKKPAYISYKIPKKEI